MLAYLFAALYLAAMMIGYTVVTLTILVVLLVLGLFVFDLGRQLFVWLGFIRDERVK